ncbi:hypothetical protein D1AOALGA4SA_1561 [Olavius algarvensis Delta 1 endosymbiont]|nr:hypothetical protein D1AOALGA4SA_1561 [Olavius algarvensis Delta 1 endosymbiont]
MGLREQSAWGIAHSETGDLGRERKRKLEFGMRNAEKEEGEKPRQMIGMTGQFLGFKGRPLGR